MTNAQQNEVSCDFNEEVRQILVLPNDDHRLHDTVNEQLKSSIYGNNVTFSLNYCLYRYSTAFQILHLNSVVVFAVNYIQNRFIVTEFCVEIAKLFEILNVKNQSEFNKAIEALKNDDSSEIVINFQSHLNSWDQFIEEIERKLDEKVGPCQVKIEEGDDELPELGVQSKTISHYVNGSPFEMVLVVVVRLDNERDK
uniref:Uncharacterized protein n=1 Tax=Heterorhabditis bacteriophora TaxID=37862 RepID=A0A1I7X1Y9_HETBA